MDFLLIAMFLASPDNYATPSTTYIFSLGENVVVAEISMDQVEKVRTNMPVHLHRRSDLYALASRHDQHFVGDNFLDGTTFCFGQYTNSGKCIVFQSRLSYVLVNKKPVLPGHLLVIPKR